MAFPWIFKSNFEGGSNAEWDSEQDTGSLLDFPHYSVLARFPWSECAPYRGAYCMRVQMGDTNDHTVREGDIDIADAATRYAAFYLYLAPDVVASADDSFNIFEFQQAAGTVEASVGLRITASDDVVEIGIGDGAAPSSYAAPTLDKNRWYHVEVEMLVSTAGVGTLTLYVDGVSVVALTTLTNAAAVGRGDLGTQDTLSTTTGTILFDRFIFDDARIYPDRERYPRTMTLTKSGHVFLGPGAIDGAAIFSTGASDIMRLFDTDTGNVNDAQGLVAELAVGAQTAVGGPMHFERGCYVQLTGTNPRGTVSVISGDDQPGTVGPRCYASVANLRRYGLNRRERPGNV